MITHTTPPPTQIGNPFSKLPSPDTLRALASESELLYNVARLAVEDELVWMRDSAISILGRRNGLVIYTSAGEPSELIRMTTETAISIGLKAIAAYLEAEVSEAPSPSFPSM